MNTNVFILAINWAKKKKSTYTLIIYFLQPRNIKFLVVYVVQVTLYSKIYLLKPTGYVKHQQFNIQQL